MSKAAESTQNKQEGQLYSDTSPQVSILCIHLKHLCKTIESIKRQNKSLIQKYCIPLHKSFKTTYLGTQWPKEHLKLKSQSVAPMVL